MEAPTAARKLADRFRGPLAAASATAGIIAGILGGWITGHWLWGPFCGLLALIAFVAAAEGLKERQEPKEANEEGALAVNSPAPGGPYTSFSYTGDTYRFGHNASVGNVTVAGGNIDDHRTTVYRSRATTIKLGGIWLVALIALVAAVSGTVSIARSHGNTNPQSPAALAAAGGHGSPRAAVMGFVGDSLQNNKAGACSYELPSEQDSCNSSISFELSMRTTSLAVGNSIVNGQEALVPMTGTFCQFGLCFTYTGNGLPAGVTFRSAYLQASTDQTNSDDDLIPCKEVNNEWYVNDPDSPGF